MLARYNIGVFHMAIFYVFLNHPSFNAFLREDLSISLQLSNCLQVEDVNDNAPKFEQDPVIIPSVAENTSPAHVIHTFMATDRDSGPNGSVLYSIETYSGKELGEGPYFDIDRQTGDLYVDGELDYEKVRARTAHGLRVGSANNV